MKFFPEGMDCKNKELFSKLNNTRNKCYLRREIYEHVISRKEDEYFSLDEFSIKKNLNIEIVKLLVKELIPEIEKLGWKCCLSYGNTGLFIYSTEKPPVNCYSSEI